MHHLHFFNFDFLVVFLSILPASFQKVMLSVIYALAILLAVLFQFLSFPFFNPSPKCPVLIFDTIFIIHEHLVKFLFKLVLCFCCLISFFIYLLISFFFSFIFISWRLITLQYCSGFCHTLT